MTTLNIFANFFIDTPERFLRMKDSFVSFEDVRANKWVINIRGRFADQAGRFLKEKLGEKLFLFQLSSNDGWFYDTRQMLKALDSDYVLFWIEDHICMCGAQKLDQLIIEMAEHEIHQLNYSWWQNGLWLKRYDGVLKESGKHVDFFEHNIETHRIAQKNGDTYLISVTGVFSLKLFRKIVLTDDPIPKRWPIEVPFDFEKSPSDVHWLPIRVALPKEELFANIDDDHGVEGYSLQSRGVYPIREARISYANHVKFAWWGYVKNSIKTFTPLFIIKIYRYLYHQFYYPLQNILKFYYVQRVKGFPIPEIPFFDPLSFEYYVEKLKSSEQYLEYGSGGSTYYAAKLGKSFMTVDSDRFFLKDVLKKIKRDKLSNAANQKFIHAHIGLTKAWGLPVFTSKYQNRLKRWSNYSESPWNRDIKVLPDLVLIDGRFRVACALKSIKNLQGKNSWTILVDDYAGRPEYKDIELFATLEKLVGSMAVFKERPNIDFGKLESAIKKYELDFD